VLGRKISYRPLTIPQYRERLEKAGLSEFMIQHFCAVAVDYQNGVFSGEDKVIAELTGKPPMTVQDFVASHREALTTARAEG
jgi:NAD(P)H dehydrogenase (quinone)